MSDTAYFFCDMDSYEQLQEKTRKAQQMNYRPQRYKILDTIILEDVQFEDFKNNIGKSEDFLQSVTSKLVFSEECEYICLAVTSKCSDVVILVCSFQYSYPKFVATVRRDNNGKKIH